MNEHHGELDHFDPDQAKLDAFLLRAGFTYGWLNLESWARVMVHQAVIELDAKDKQINDLIHDNERMLNIIVELQKHE